MESIADSNQTNSLQDIESYLTDFNKEIAEQTQAFAYNPADGSLVATGALYSTDDGVLYQTTAVPVEFKQEGTQHSDQMAKQLQQPVVGTIRVSEGSIEILTANGNVEGQDASFALAAGIQDNGYQEQSGMVGHEHVGALQDSTQPVNVGGGQEISSEDHAGLSGSSQYQTVTIVPSEINQSGEVSYMLIVSQPDDDKADNPNADMSIFDFKEEAMKVESMQNSEETKRIKATTRSQSAGMSMQLMCNYCNYTSPKRFLLARHMRAHSEERPYNCTTCGRTFKTPIALQNHVNTHKGIRPNKCKECDASFTTSGELIRHVRYRHTYEKPHKCSECDYASVELSKLKRHVRSHTGERPFQCPHCMYASPDSFKLKRHLRVHTGEKPYVCDICDMHFTQSNSLKSHKLIHSGNKPVFQCELCPTTCGRKTDLKNHVLKIHTSDRPLQCKKCGKSFPDRYTYKIHTRTHDGQKCFRCELCPYSALMQRHLESHILTHTGEKPFRCESCDQSFRQKQLLKRHINLYHNPSYIPPAPRSKRHICKECGKVFAHRGNMLRHLAMHDPENAEYQDAIQNGDASVGEEDEEEEQNHRHDDGSVENTDVQLYNDQYLTHQHPIQVQLVPVQSEEGQQVYIQIDSSQMGLLRQMEANAREDQDETTDGPMSEAQNEPEMTATTPVRRGRGRPRKSVVQQPEDSDEDYIPASTPRRGRGRPPKANKVTRPEPRRKRRLIVKEEEEEEEDEEEEVAGEEEEEREDSGELQETQEEEEEENDASEKLSRKRQAEESPRVYPSKRVKREMSSSPTLEFDVSG